MITAPGVYDITAAEYHRDPCPEPSLSSSGIKTLLARSPGHFKREHPRLGDGAEPREPTREMLIGTAVHALALGKGAEIEYVLVNDWRTKEAREARDAATAAGKVCLLRDDYLKAALTASCLNGMYDVRPREGDRVEQALIWQERGVWCRAMPDWITGDGKILVDLKTTDNASPQVARKRLFDLGYHIQAAWYLRGYEKVTGIKARFLITFIERDLPHGCITVELDAAALELGRRQCMAGLDIFERCMRSDDWPLYPRGVVKIEHPGWYEAAAMDRELMGDVRPDFMEHA